MANFKGKFESSKQDWETPDKLFNPLDTRFNFNFDMAANRKNKKCVKYYSKKDNALRQTWFGNCWLNPPYGGVGTNKLSVWVEKAFNESQKKNCFVVMLIPARTNTRWWHMYCMRAYEIMFIEGRPKFGGAVHGLPQPLALIYFNGTHIAKVSTFTMRKTCG